MFRNSALPQALPDSVGIHYASINLPFTCKTPKEVTEYMRHFTNAQEWIADFNKGKGERGGFKEYYTLQNVQGEVLVTLCTDGKGKAAGKTRIQFNGKCFEKSALNCLLDNDGNPLNLLEIANKVYALAGKFTGVDVYKDDFKNVLPFDTIRKLSHRGMYKDRVVTILNKDLKGKQRPPLSMSSDSDSVYYGNRYSNQILFYAKNLKEGTKWQWTRVELKLRTVAHCNALVGMLLDGADLDTLIKGILRNYVEFKKAAGNVRKERRPTETWWDDFTGTDKIRFPKAPTKRTKNDELFDEVAF